MEESKIKKTYWKETAILLIGILIGMFLYHIIFK